MIVDLFRYQSDEDASPSQWGDRKKYKRNKKICLRRGKKKKKKKDQEKNECRKISVNEKRLREKEKQN